MYGNIEQYWSSSSSSKLFVNAETASAPNYYKVLLKQTTLSSISTNYFNKTSYKMSNKIMFFKFTTSHYWFNRAIYQPSKKKENRKRKLFYIIYTLSPHFLFIYKNSFGTHKYWRRILSNVLCLYVCGLKKMNKKDDILLYDFFFSNTLYPYVYYS